MSQPRVDLWSLILDPWFLIRGDGGYESFGNALAFLCAVEVEGSSSGFARDVGWKIGGNGRGGGWLYVTVMAKEGMEVRRRM